MQAKNEEMESKLATALEEKQLIMDYPHTVWTVANVLGLNLTHEELTKANLLANKISNKSINMMMINPKEVAACMMMRGENIMMNHFKSNDLWIVKLL